MCRLRAAAHFVRGSAADHGWPRLTPAPRPGIVLMQIMRGNQFSGAQFDQTSAYWASAPHENLPILAPPPTPLLMHAGHPHTKWGAPGDPEGSRCPCSPPTSLCGLLTTPLTLSGPATIPGPAPETAWLEFKVNVPVPLSAGGSVQPLSRHTHAAFATLSHKL